MAVTRDCMQLPTQLVSGCLADHAQAVDIFHDLTYRPDYLTSVAPLWLQPVGYPKLVKGHHPIMVSYHHINVGPLQDRCTMSVSRL